ncbi:MAG: response regulator [Bdellovibrionota bacterium]
MFSNAQKLRILLIDDVETDRIVEKAMLVSLGITNVDEAENGAIARFKIENAINASSPYDLILSDWNMPMLNGIELAKILKKDDAMKNTPFILLTGIADEHKVHLALKIGVSDYVLKPVQKEILKEKLARFFKLSL